MPTWKLPLPHVWQIYWTRSRCFALIIEPGTRIWSMNSPGTFDCRQQFFWSFLMLISWFIRLFPPQSNRSLATV